MNFDFSKQKNKKIAIVEKTKITLVDIAAITYLKCDGYVTTIYLITNNKVIVSKLLKHFENELIGYGFLRIHHNTIVNMRYITGVLCSKSGRIIQINKTEIKVSRRKVFLIKDFLK